MMPVKAREWPWWFFALCLLAIIFAVLIGSDPLYRQVFFAVAKGLGKTAFVTVTAFSAACVMGLFLALMSLSPYQFPRQITRFYVELIRGIPILVLLFYVTFVAAPALVSLYNVIFAPLHMIGLVEEAQTRDFSLEWRAIIALTIGYSAFLSEIFRAGILSVGSGQIEAAKSLGLGRWLSFRLVVFPQGIRTILPPLGNDFVSMVKDSSLVSILGVSDITQLGKVYASGSFRFFETYSIVAYLYLIITISLSLALRRFEKHLRRSEGR